MDRGREGQTNRGREGGERERDSEGGENGRR